MAVIKSIETYKLEVDGRDTFVCPLRKHVTIMIRKKDLPLKIGFDEFDAYLRIFLQLREFLVSEKLLPAMDGSNGKKK